MECSDSDSRLELIRQDAGKAQLLVTRLTSGERMDIAADYLAIDGKQLWLIRNYLLPGEADFESVDSDACIRGAGAHLWVPYTGYYGMNAGIAAALNLS